MRSERALSVSVFLFSALATAGAACGTAVAAVEALPAIAANDNRIPAGRRAGTTLALDLDVTRGRWFPDGPGSTAIPIEAFAERGRAPQIPGPLVRVRVGTDVRVRVRNTLATPLVLHDLVDLPSTLDRPFVVAPGAERVVRFHAYAPGTYYYWATTTKSTFDERMGPDAMLSGAIVVDPPGRVAPDRIFSIGTWDNVRDAKGNPKLAYELLTINGRAWPATERLSYAQNAEVRWRLINTTGGTHPMHLHGFPFAVFERGDGRSVRHIANEREVTELLDPGQTAAFAWMAKRPGEWMFHCHLAYHIIAHAPTAMMLANKPGLDFVTSQKRAPQPGPMEMDMNDGMGGLILGVTIHRDPHVALAPDVVPRRHLRLDVAPRPGPTVAPGAPVVPPLQYALSEGGRAVPSIGVGAPPLVLTQGEPVGIEIHNALDEPTAVHWHGIEIADPYYDGPAGFANARRRLAPMIMPGRTFEARFTPTRAGTFIYHSHMDDVWQVAGGLAGPLIVLEPGTTLDPSRDHVVMLTTPHEAKYWGTAIDVNGTVAPPPIAMVAGVRQRLRLINLTTFDADVFARVVSTDAPPLTWRLRARDGIDLERSQVAPRDVVVTIGATRDLEFVAPATGHYALQIVPDRSSPAYVTIPLQVATQVGRS